MSAILFSLSLVGGVLLGGYASLEPWVLGLALVPLALIPILRHRELLIRIAIILAAFLTGASLLGPSSSSPYPGQIEFYPGEGDVTLRGMVREPPQMGDISASLILSAGTLDTGDEWQGVEGDVLIRLNRYPEYHYGDILEVQGKLQPPEPFSDFDYPAYLASQGIYAVMFYPEVRLVEEGQGLPVLTFLYTLQDDLARSLSRVLPEPQASLAQSLTLGTREGLPQGVRDDFAHSGLSHLLAISGMHLGVIAGMLLGLGRWLFGRQGYHYVWLGLGGVWGYAALTGMNPPVIRGAIMVSTLLIGDLFGRQHSTPIALTLAAAIMVGLDPTLLGEASFQMSFAATAGIIFISPLLGPRKGSAEPYTLRRLVEIPWSLLALSAGALLGAGPVILYHFGELPLLSPLASLLTVPLLAPVIILSGLSALIGLFALPLAQVLGWLSWPLLSYLLGVAQAFAGLPLAVKMVSPSPFALGAYYLALTLAIMAMRNPERLGLIITRLKGFILQGAGVASAFFHKGRAWLIPAILIVAVTGTLALISWPSDNLEVSFIDVGQGDAILIQQGTTQIVIDGGPSPEVLLTALGEKMPFWDRTIELLVLTHPQSDHLRGLVEVANTFKVDGVIQPDIYSDAPLYAQWLQVIEEREIDLRIVAEGDVLSWGDVSLSILNPPRSGYQGEDLNDSSLVCYLSYGEVGFLFTGDVGASAELELSLKRLIPDCTVLKVAHHGSSDSSALNFLSQARPEAAVISVGRDNPFGHPSSDTIQRLEDVVEPGHIYRTDYHGDITFITDGQRLWVRTQK